MSNYSQTTFFTPKDSLPPTNPAKTIFGAAYDVEFGNIATAITSKADAVSTISSITGTANQIGVVNVAGAVTLSLPQNVIIPTPAAGTALVANGASTGIAFRAVSQGATGVPIVADTNTFTNPQNIQIAASGSTAGTYGIGLDSSVNLIIGRTDVAHTALTISLAGNVTISAPSSGIGLLLNTTDSVTAFEWATASTIVQGQTSGANSFFGTSNSSSFNLITNNQNRLGISNSGAVTIAAPTSSTALAVAGSASQHVANFIANSTAGGSFGVLIEAGTNASDAALEVLNQAASTAYFQVLGNGGVVVGAPTGGNQGLGTVNATGLFINGVQTNPVAVKVKATGTNRISTTTLSNDPDLVFAITTAGTYKIEVIAGVNCNGSAANGISFTINYSGTITAGEQVSQTVMTGAGTIAAAGAISAVVTTPTGGTAGGTGANNGVQIEAVLVAGGAGIVGFSWAQSVSTATNTTLNAGSTMIITRIA